MFAYSEASERYRRSLALRIRNGDPTRWNEALEARGQVDAVRAAYVASRHRAYPPARSKLLSRLPGTSRAARAAILGENAARVYRVPAGP